MLKVGVAQPLKNSGYSRPVVLHHIQVSWHKPLGLHVMPKMPDAPATTRGIMLFMLFLFCNTPCLNRSH